MEVFMEIIKRKCEGLPTKSKVALVILSILAVLFSASFMFFDDVIVGEGIYIGSDGVVASSGFNIMYLYLIMGAFSTAFVICIVATYLMHKNDFIHVFDNKVVIHVKKDEYELDYKQIQECKFGGINNGITIKSENLEKPIKVFWIKDATKVVTEINKQKRVIEGNK